MRMWGLFVWWWQGDLSAKKKVRRKKVRRKSSLVPYVDYHPLGKW